MPKNDIELRSEEVQEVMNRVPPAILRWGITVMAVIVAVFICLASFIKIPITEECPFTMIWENNADYPTIKISIPPSAIQAVVSGDKTVRISSNALPNEFSNGIAAIITEVSSSVLPDGSYEAAVKLSPDIIELLSKDRIMINGTASIVVSHKTLFSSIRGMIP